MAYTTREKSQDICELLKGNDVIATAQAIEPDGLPKPSDVMNFIAAKFNDTDSTGIEFTAEEGISVLFSATRPDSLSFHSRPQGQVSIETVRITSNDPAVIARIKELGPALCRSVTRASGGAPKAAAPQ